MPQYDYVIVGAGLFGSIFAHEAKKANKKCLVIDKRNHIGGNVYTENIHGINVHKYGAHIFHTSNKKIWDYISQFAEFNNYILNLIAIHKGVAYNLPFNMNTFSKIWPDVITPSQAIEKISKDKPQISHPKNLEEQAISMIGNTLYEKLNKGYVAKQWGRKCTELPSFIIKRIPLRFTYDNNYYNDIYQGCPIGGYTNIFEKLLDGIDIALGVDFL